MSFCVNSSGDNIDDEFDVLMQCTKFDEFRRQVSYSLRELTVFDSLNKGDKFRFIMSRANDDYEIFKIVRLLLDSVMGQR